MIIRSAEMSNTIPDQKVTATFLVTMTRQFSNCKLMMQHKQGREDSGGAIEETEGFENIAGICFGIQIMGICLIVEWFAIQMPELWELDIQITIW